MNKLNINSCPLCGGMHLKHVYTCTDYYASGEQFELLSCEECGFTFTQDFPIGNAIDGYYDSSEYISHTDTRKGMVNNIYHQVRKYMLRRKVQLIFNQTHRATGRLLDIGTGTGYFPAAMNKRGWEAEGIEKNEQARNYGINKFGITVNDESALMKYAPGTFDVITLWHVMEHLENLDVIWKRINELLTDTGIVVVAVPNCSSFDAAKYGANWAAFDVPRHLWHFTPVTMQRWGAKHGFVMAARYPMPFDAFYISMLSEKNMNSRMPFIKGMWAGSVSWLRTLMKKDGSSSMIYIFRKKRNEK